MRGRAGQSKAGRETQLPFTSFIVLNKLSISCVLTCSGPETKFLKVLTKSLTFILFKIYILIHSRDSNSH